MIIDPDDKIADIRASGNSLVSREFWRFTLKAKAPRESGGSPVIALVQAADLRDGNHLANCFAGWMGRGPDSL